MPTKIYVAPETPVTFKASGGTVVFTPQNVASAAGRISTQWDRGTGSKPGWYEWRAKTKAGSALTVGTQLEIYLATSDGTIVDGNLGTSDAALAAGDKRRNLQPVGSIVSDSTSSGEVQHGSGQVFIVARYVSVVWWNATGVTLTNTAGDHEFILTPIPDELQ
jgi:hypothetical protein